MANTWGRLGQRYLSLRDQTSAKGKARHHQDGAQKAMDHQRHEWETQFLLLGRGASW